MGGNPLGLLVLVDPLPSIGGGKGEGEGEGEGKGGRAPFPLPNSDSHGGGHPLWAALFSPMAHVGPLLSPGGFGNPPVLQYVPGTPETIPVSKYYRPIYQSLPLNHFETPRHVRDLIRDSEQSLVTKNT